jgi:hypothetical protein
MFRPVQALLLFAPLVWSEPMGLFVSTSAFGNGTTAYGKKATAALELICAHFTASTSRNRIHSLALDHLTDANGKYRADSVAGLAPYFSCFDAVFVGTADNHFTSDIYCKAVVNTSFTDEYVARSLRAATRFNADHPAAEFPNLRWYLNYEAAGNYFATGCSEFRVAQLPPPPNPKVSARAFTAAYTGMFAALTQGLAKIRPGTAIMWSPTFNFQSSFVSESDRALLVANVAEFLRGVPLLRQVANQDAVGKYSLYNSSSRTFTYNLTCADTLFYQALLSEAAAAAATPSSSMAAPTTPSAAPAVGANPAAVTVNMELFSRRSAPAGEPQTTITGDPAEHEARKCCYAAHNLTIGPSWELTDWYVANFLEWSPD